MTNAFPISNRTHVGDTITYKCKLGYTRFHWNAYSIACVADDGIPKWTRFDQLEGCQINYCNLSELIIENAELLNTSRGQIPDDFERTANQSWKFNEQAALSYKCISNYHFNNSEIVTTKCIFPTNQIGFGHWEPAKLICTRKKLMSI